MEQVKIEHELLEQALQAFQEETGLALEVIQEQAEIKGHQVDAIVRMPHRGGKLAVEIKRWAQQANVGALAEQVKRLPIDAFLAADYINPNMAKKLKAMDVQFIDTVGNAYINQPPLYVHVAGNKQGAPTVTTKETANRAFDATGLKVVFGFLCDPLLVNEAYREIARQTGVALGTVGWVLKGLNEAGFIIDRGRGRGRRLINRPKLLDRWVEAYPEKLKPKLQVGEFIADDPHWWKAIEIEKYGAYWGGEVAAAKYTGNLRPQCATIYLPEHAGKALLAKARLRKNTKHKDIQWAEDEAAIVKIYRPFWPDNIKREHTEYRYTKREGLVNPILVYADLIATGDSRNLEIGRVIHEQFITELIGED
ncbi:hypothetical protein A9Q81_00090 [Gammaproteobacteria bacterium 42_54_T18]|nr:hypothetical protein A9Q81_00090 [Gammaproteobacteria bacterium 42_54_T18]